MIIINYRKGGEPMTTEMALLEISEKIKKLEYQIAVLRASEKLLKTYQIEPKTYEKKSMSSVDRTC